MGDMEDEALHAFNLACEIRFMLNKAVAEKKIHPGGIGMVLESLCVGYFRSWNDPVNALDYLYEKVKEQLPRDHKTPFCTSGITSEESMASCIAVLESEQKEGVQ